MIKGNRGALKSRRGTPVSIWTSAVKESRWEIKEGGAATKEVLLTPATDGGEKEKKRRPYSMARRNVSKEEPSE